MCANCRYAWIGIDEGKKFDLRGVNISSIGSTVSTNAVMRNVVGAPNYPSAIHLVDIKELCVAIGGLIGRNVDMNFGEHDYIELTTEEPNDTASIPFYDNQGVNYHPWSETARLTADLTKSIVIPSANFRKVVGLSLPYWKDVPESVELHVIADDVEKEAILIYNSTQNAISNTMKLQMVPEAWSASVNIEYLNNICKALPQKSLLSLSVGKKSPIMEAEVYFNDRDSIRYDIVQFVKQGIDYDYRLNGMTDGGEKVERQR